VVLEAGGCSSCQHWTNNRGEAPSEWVINAYIRSNHFSSCHLKSINSNYRCLQRTLVNALNYSNSALVESIRLHFHKFQHLCIPAVLNTVHSLQVNKKQMCNNKAEAAIKRTEAFFLLLHLKVFIAFPQVKCTTDVHSLKLAINCGYTCLPCYTGYWLYHQQTPSCKTAEQLPKASHV